MESPFWIQLLDLSVDEDALCPRGVHQLHSLWQSLILLIFQQPPSLTPKHRDFVVLWQPWLPHDLPVCPVVYWNCSNFVCLSAVSVWCVKSLGGTTSAPVTLGGKSFPLTSVESPAWRELAGAARATVNQGLFSRSHRCAGNVIPG